MKGKWTKEEHLDQKLAGSKEGLFVVCGATQRVVAHASAFPSQPHSGSSWVPVCCWRGRDGAAIEIWMPTAQGVWTLTPGFLGEQL